MNKTINSKKMPYMRPEITVINLKEKYGTLDVGVGTTSVQNNANNSGGANQADAPKSNLIFGGETNSVSSRGSVWDDADVWDDDI